MGEEEEISEMLVTIRKNEDEVEKLGKLLWQFSQLYWEILDRGKMLDFRDIGSYVDIVSEREGLSIEEAGSLEWQIYIWLLGIRVDSEVSHGLEVITDRACDQEREKRKGKK